MALFGRKETQSQNQAKQNQKQEKQVWFKTSQVTLLLPKIWGAKSDDKLRGKPIEGLDQLILNVESLINAGQTMIADSQIMTNFAYVYLTFETDSYQTSMGKIEAIMRGFGKFYGHDSIIMLYEENGYARAF